MNDGAEKLPSSLSQKRQLKAGGKRVGCNRQFPKHLSSNLNATEFNWKMDGCFVAEARKKPVELLSSNQWRIEGGAARSGLLMMRGLKEL